MAYTLTDIPNPTVILITPIEDDCESWAEPWSLLALQASNLCTVGGLICCGPYDLGADQLYGIAKWWRQETTIPVAAWQGTVPGVTGDPTFDPVSARFGAGAGRASYADSTVGLTAMLTAAANGSVIVLMTGFANVAVALLNTPAGQTLWAAKVARVVVNAGIWPVSLGQPGAPEFNIAHDAANWSTFFGAGYCPSQIVMVGIEQGDTVLTAPPTSIPPNNDPTRYAYYLFTTNDTRASWGTLAAWYAVKGGNGGQWSNSANGAVTINTGTGQNAWTAVPSNGQYYLTKVASDATFVTAISTLLATQPASPSAVPYFTPALLAPNLVCWTRGDNAGGGATNDAGLADWLDGSGLGNDPLQPTAGNRPTYKTNQINGLPAVLFATAGAKSMRTPTIAHLGSTWSIFLALKAAAAPSGNFHRVLDLDTGNANFFVGTNSDGTQWVVKVNGVTLAGGTVTTSATILEVMYDGSQTTLWQDGVYAGFADAGAWGLDAQAIVLGAYNGATGFEFNGEIGEFLWVNQIVGAYAQLNVRYYLNSRWATYSPVPVMAGAPTGLLALLMYYYFD